MHIIYARKSSESEDRQAESIPAQLDILNELARRKELVVERVFSESKSAKAPGRPEFTALVDYIEKGEPKGIICWKLNRLFRNPKDEGTIRWLLSSGAITEIVTPSKTYHEADSDFSMAVEGAQAQRFIRDLKEDTARGINRKLEKGIAPILAPPGYVNNKFMNQGEKDISPHPLYFEMMRKIFDLALTGNYSVQRLFEVASEMGIKNSRGKEISRTQMYRLLTSPFYKGEFIYAGQTYQGSHKPLITDSEYSLIQNYIRQRSRPRSIKHEWPFTGLVKCASCGRQITAEKHTKKSGLVFTYYKCTGVYRYGCPTPYVPEEKFEQMAYEYLKRIKLSSRFVQWAIKVLKRQTDEERSNYQNKFKEIRKRSDEVDEAIYNLKMKYATGNRIDEATYDRGLAELKEKKTGLSKLLSKEDKNFDLYTDVAVASLKFAAEAQKRWSQDDPSYKKGILRVIGSELLLTEKGELEIKPRTPFLVIQKAVQSAHISTNARLNSVVEFKPRQSVSSGTVVGG